MAPGGYKHILVAMDKFTEWIEVHDVTAVTSKEAAKFIEDITHRFGVPNMIVTDLGYPRQPHRRLLFLSGPSTLQRPGQVSKQQGASGHQRLHLRRRLAVRDQMAS
jgi:hypothetical protein